MGATGSGKTSFINLLSNSNLNVGKGLRSCTNTVQVADAFNLAGRRVVLIDTPGFDDTSLSDVDVLNMIAAFLENSYEGGRKLAGVLYFHRISDPKMTGISRRNFGMFRKLCGDNALQNVVIVTNMWGQVDLEVGKEREAELKREDDFFKPVLDKGGRMERHENTALSAERIVRLILGNNPLPLHIQKELVDEGKAIPDTAAGEELNRELNAQIERHREEMRVLREDLEQAIKDKDEETRRELDVEIQRLQMKVEGLLDDSKRMASDYKLHIDEIKDTLRKEKARGHRQAKVLNRLRDGFFSRIAAYLDGVDL
ncbi:P-loop containing nucleoside triphosphate hydrolase protein [Thelephora terrestris]|uniref:P-loop containing nucleoside triphosphate hydrolase protein n=1 Tax=Thelephora terrestris TaxID=56493 RepID=A0A9P6HJU5_9AGAM|nr:P-loop containing nucleoside triphosphate hydrolase protein [Thelephora terrestris]